jgi:hypothetical protein
VWHILGVQSALVRQCLQQLHDEEIEDLLDSSEGLREGVREEANRPRGARVDAQLFRRWMGMPSASDSLLRRLPAIYTREYEDRLHRDKPIRRTVGARALLALHESDGLTVDRFKILLAEFRSSPEVDSEPGLAEPVSAHEPAVAEDAPGNPIEAVIELRGAASLDSDTVGEAITRLRDHAQSAANALANAADQVMAGLPLPASVHEAMSSWTTLLEESWAAFGTNEVPPVGAFEVFEALRDRLIEQESAEQAKREEKLAKLTTLRQGAAGLEVLAASDETYRDALDRALSQISELQHELSLIAESFDDATGEDASDTTERDSDEEHPTDDTASDRDTFTATDTKASNPGEVVSETFVQTRGSDGANNASVAPATLERAADAEDARTATLPSEPGEADADILTEAIKTEPAATTVDEPSEAETHPSGTGGLDAGSSVTDCADELADFVRAGLFGAAWLVAQAAGLQALDAAAYRLAATAFHSGPGGLDPAEVLIGLTTTLDGAEFVSLQSARVALAATLRAALAAGWTPRSELETVARQTNLDERWRAVVEAAIAAGDRNYQHLQDVGRRFEPSIDEIHAHARRLQTQLDQLRIKFSRADKVLRYLLRRHEPLGAAFEAMLAPTTGEQRREALTTVLGALELPAAVIQAADQVVNSPQQRRTHIVAHARNTLVKAIESVAECVAEAVNGAVADAASDNVAVIEGSRDTLVAAANAVSINDERAGAGDEALARLLAWITAPEPPIRVESEVQLLINESLSLTSVDRDEDGLPIIVAIDPHQVIEELRTPRQPRELYDAFVARGDLQEAAAVVSQMPDLQDQIVQERARWARKLSNEVSAVLAEVGRTYADDFTQEARVDAEARLVEPADYSGDRFDFQMAELQRLRDGLGEYRAQTAEVLHARVAQEVSQPGDRDSIIELINKEDFVGANELLALARSGPLPALDEPDDTSGARVFDAFMTDLSDLNIEAGAPAREVAAAFIEKSGEDATARHGDIDRLNIWNNLVSKRTPGTERQAIISSIMRAIGLDVRGEVSKQTTSGRHFDLYRVNAAPVDKSLVPGLGSQATHYMVAATNEHDLLRETLSSAFRTNDGPNIVLFDGVLSIEERCLCLTECRDQKISAIVVDHAVVAWVAAHHPRSFRAVQQITLPFTCFSHYTVVAGNVPDEVFVGRADELTQLTNRTGSLFVYGGRQLGKSALLRKIQRDFNAVSEQQAIFIDLNAHGIGTWSESRKLWQVLYNELANVAGFGLKPNPTVRNHEPVIRAIQNWLDGNQLRRLLLLLDETDAFLEKESGEAPRGFRNIGPLKGLFDNTEGRFKPVFAGLHKVQRLKNVANTPLAHGGRDVLIGPLAAKPARDLVVKPLEALGYRFDNPDAVWRLLAFTNLQPGIIQVVCSDLIEHLQKRPLRKGEPLIAITDDDIDAVFQDPFTVDKIAEKLHLTIELEDRYRVIALTVAIMCINDSFRERYTADDIRGHCEVYWQEGFADLNSTEFVVYLDELIGLGVLFKDREDRYSVRSPNIVTMLGSRDQLETVLEEEEFQLEPEYSPQSVRRQVTIRGTALRSPLSEHDLGELVPVNSKYEPHNFVIVGTEALGIANVAPVLESVGEERNTEVTVLDGASDFLTSSLADFKFAIGGHSAPRLLVVDASHVPPQQSADIVDAVQSLRKREHGHLVVVYGAEGVDAANSFFNRPNVVDTRRINLEKWSGDGIRSWHDNPFTTPEARSQLLSHSGGWPELVERAVVDVANGGISYSEEWQRLSNFPPDADEAVKFLRRTGIGDHVRELLIEWAAFNSTDYESIADVADVLGRDSDDMRAVANELTQLGVIDAHNDAYMIDPVVMRALLALT